MQRMPWESAASIAEGADPSAQCFLKVKLGPMIDVALGTAAPPAPKAEPVKQRMPLEPQEAGGTGPSVKGAGRDPWRLSKKSMLRACFSA